MAYNTYTTADLIDDVLLLGHIPTANNTFTDADLLRIAELELQTSVIKQIMMTRGGYYLTYEDFSANTDGLYDIPVDAIAGALANVEMVQNTTIIQVNLIVESEQFATNSPTSTSYGFFMRGNKVQILPTPPIGDVRLWYFKRTSRMVTTSSACLITAIASNVISVSSVPSTITVGAGLDALGDQPPFNILSANNIVTGISGTDITLTTAVDDLAVGDWLALHKQTPVPQIPVEYRILLAQRIVVKVYELQGYLDKMKAAEAKLKEYEADVFSLINPRVQSQTRIIAPSNGGFLSGNGNRRGIFPAGHSS